MCDAPTEDSEGDCDVVIGGRGDVKRTNKIVVAEPRSRDSGGDHKVEDTVLEPKGGIERLVEWRRDVEDVPSILGEDVDITVGSERGYGGKRRWAPVKTAVVLFEVVEGEPLDGGELEALYAVLCGRIVVVVIFTPLICVVLVFVVVVVVVVTIIIILVIVIYPSLDASGGREGERVVVGEVEEAGDGDELEGIGIIYGKVGEDADGHVVVAFIVEGVCLADDLDVGPLWELVLGRGMQDSALRGSPAGRWRGWTVVVAVWDWGQRPTRAFPRDGHCLTRAFKYPKEAVHVLISARDHPLFL